MRLSGSQLSCYLRIPFCSVHSLYVNTCFCTVPLCPTTIHFHAFSPLHCRKSENHSQSSMHWASLSTVTEQPCIYSLWPMIAFVVMMINHLFSAKIRDWTIQRPKSSIYSFLSASFCLSMQQGSSISARNTKNLNHNCQLKSQKSSAIAFSDNKLFQQVAFLRWTRNLRYFFVCSPLQKWMPSA